MKVLIDTNIRRRAITQVTKMVPRTIQWGHIQTTLSVAEGCDNLPREDELFVSEQIPYLEALTTAAKDGRLKFYTSFELQMEEFRQPCIDGSEGYFGTNLFQDVPLEKIQCPIQRSLLIGGFKSIGITEEEQMDFFRSIQHPRFLQITSVVGEAHIDDAYHLWSAEEAQLDIFLTLDKRFWNVINNQKKNLNSAVLVMTPKELSEHLKATGHNDHDQTPS